MYWLAHVLVLVSFCAAAGVASEVATEPDTERVPITPSRDNAKDNAFHIFNAVHSAGRLWGSSLNHNGFGFFPAVVPRGSLLYHGAHTYRRPQGIEWLAFEIEHSELFSRQRLADGQLHAYSVAQKPLAGSIRDDDDEEVVRGYLHTYRASRDLNVLYIDGMSAGGSKFGSLDSQDLLLCENKTDSWGDYKDEFGRATSICDMITKWGFDGFMRTEIGFEIVYCDFNHGLDSISVTRSFLFEERLGSDDLRLYQLARAVNRDYDGLGLDRLRIDFSAMVSGFFFPINISSTDPDRPDLIRLESAGLRELQDIKAHLLRVCLRPRSFGVNWQAIVDGIVSRFAGRLAVMAPTLLSSTNFINELEKVTLTYFDAPPSPKNTKEKPWRDRTAQAIQRCTVAHLMPALAVQETWSPEDQLIHTAIEAVTGHICSTLFSIRSTLLEASVNIETSGYKIRKGDENASMDRAITTSRQVLRHLMEDLAWTEWKKIRPCPVDQVWFVAMSPFGTEEDHWNPGCRTIEEMTSSRMGYWGYD